MKISVETWLGCMIAAIAVVATSGGQAAESVPPVALGTQLEPLVDDFLIDAIHGDGTLRLHRPEPREVVLVADQPWEGNTSAYFTLFRDGDRFRMYYRGSHYDTETKRAAHPEVTCYAESRDGIHWEKPRLGLFEFDGSTENNIVWMGAGSHNFTPFKDTNPACPPEARYKALAGIKEYGGGLQALQSPDGIHWSRIQDAPVITEGAFDSQNLAFWDAHAGCYRACWRIFKDGVRDIRTATSKDFLHWEPWQDLDYGDAPREHLYTNAILPYERAPHILLGFPTRFLPATQQVEPTFMASRDRVHWKRWLDAVIPLDAPKDRDGNRSNYMAWGLFALPGEDRELSVFGTEAYYIGPASRLRRFVYRTDGFVSFHAEAQAAELRTKTITFSGKTLTVNFATRPEGFLRIELQSPDGNPLPGFAENDAVPLRGDALAEPVRWRGGPDVSALAGRPIRIRFILQSGDLYAFRFAD